MQFNRSSPNKNMTTLHLKKSIGRSPLQLGFLLVLLALGLFVLSPTAQAQLSPPPDGGYPNENTAEGEDALFSLTTGNLNTAMGFHALYTDTTGRYNTAIGDAALMSNTTSERNTAVGSHALYFNTTGLSNTAIGAYTMVHNTTG